MMKKAMKKIGWGAVLFLSALGWAQVAEAACTLGQAVAQYQDRRINYSFGRSSISVPRDVPVGTVIARAQIYSTEALGSSLICTEGNDLVTTRYIPAERFRVGSNIGTLLLQAAGRDSGVGLQIIDENGESMALSVSGVTSTAYQRFIASGGTGENRPPYHNGFSEANARRFAQVVLIKTSELSTPGVAVTSGLISLAKLNFFAALHLYLSDNITIAPQTCSVTMPSSVNLGNWRSTAFTGINSTTTAVNFNLNVNCTGLNTAVHMTMSDPSNNGNTGTTLPLTAGSGATGVGVQVLRRGALIRMGPDSSVRGNTNQFFLFNANSTTPTFNADFQARYIQTSDTVTPGTANSRVTVTMSYQ